MVTPALPNTLLLAVSAIGACDRDRHPDRLLRRRAARQHRSTRCLRWLSVSLVATPS